MQSLEEIAYDAAVRALDKQERVLEELRARTGVLVAASSLAASFLGRDAFSAPPSVGLGLTAVVAFLASMSAGVFVLTPRPALTFAMSGPELYERFYVHGDDLNRVHRSLTYDLHRFWARNNVEVTRIVRAYRFAAAALVIEVLALVTLISDTLL